MDFETFTGLLQCESKSDGRASAKCPAHEGKNKHSLGVKRGSDGKIVVHCFVGCSPQEIVAAMGLTMADLFPKGEIKGPYVSQKRARDLASARLFVDLHHPKPEERGEMLEYAVEHLLPKLKKD